MENPEVVEICPECGQDLRGQSIIAHDQNHWPDRLPDYPQLALARERHAILMTLQAAREARKYAAKE